MSAIDLILLGSLCQSPKSPYELQKQVEERNLSRWVKISSYTVYKKVVQYEFKGLVTSKTEKSGNMPEKTVYSITLQGMEHFKRLMTELSSTQTRLFLDFNSVVVNLSLLNEAEADECVQNIKNSIQNTKMQLEKSLSRHENIPFYGKTIIEQQLMLLETLEVWEQSFERKLAENKGEKREGE